MELKGLTGKHILSGLETGVISEDRWRHHYENCRYVKFTLDGVTYMAVEDPDDGYRSYLQDLVVTEEPCKIRLPNVEVLCSMRDDSYDAVDILVFTDAINGKEFLEVGTDFSDSYYPWCVMEYTPENMSCNEGRDAL